MNEIIFCVCLTSAIWVLQIVLKWCRRERKKIQVKKESQQSRSRWWIWLVSRCSERTPDVQPSTAWKSPAKTRHESQFPLSSRTEQHHRTGRPVRDAYSSSYTEWNVDKTLSSQEWKSDDLMEDRTVRPVVSAQHTDKYIVENDNMDSYTGAESEMSLESRSLLHRVNDQVRKRQNQSSKDATKDSDKHSVIWRMFLSSTLQAFVFMEKNYSDNLRSIKKKQKTKSMEGTQLTGKTLQGSIIFGWWWRSHQSLAHKGLRIFRFCIMPWKDEREPTIKYCMGRQIDVVQKFTRVHGCGQNCWWAKGIRVAYLHRIHHTAACPWSSRVTVKIERRTRKFHWTDYLHVDVQRHLMGN